MRNKGNLIWSILSVIILFLSGLVTVRDILLHYEKGFAICYFFLWIFSFGYIIQASEEEIRQLKRENEILKDTIEHYKSHQEKH